MNMEKSTGGTASGGSSGSSMVSAYGQIGDNLHKNFSANLNSAISFHQEKEKIEMEKENTIYNRIRSIMDELQRRREVLFSQGLQKRQMSMSEQEAALRNHANEVGIRKAIEESNDKERISKNFLAGMMKSFGSM